MIINTVEEIRLFLPNHQLNDIQGLKGYIDSSERDFLVDKLGKPLYKALLGKYSPQELLPENEEDWTDWHRLIRAAQPVVMFDALYRSADLSVISINDSGINIASTDNYEAAGENLIEKYKSRCNKEAHRAVDRMLVLLEDWTQEVGSKVKENEGKAEGETDIAKETIVELWKQSKYFYQNVNLFISTATQMQEYLDIYESREKFVSLIPDLKYIQTIYIASEIGQGFMDYLLKRSIEGTAESKEKILIDKIRWWLAFHVESRSKLFSRKDAAGDAIKMRQMVIDYIKSNYDSFKENIGLDSPLYVAENIVVSSEKRWQNNRPGSKLFVTPGISMKP